MGREVGGAGGGSIGGTGEGSVIVVCLRVDACLSTF